MSIPIIEVNNLSKHYKTFSRRSGVAGGFKDLFVRDYKTLTAVDSISFKVNEGELLGYIGPNGAGKSTSIKMLTGILKPSSGEMRVGDFHPFLDRKVYTKNIGVVFGQRTQLWWDIAVQESFKLLRSIYEVSEKDFDIRLAELNEILSLNDLLTVPVRKLSLGQRMRCDLAASLLHRPKVLFLDEPTIGLDAVAKNSIRKFLKHVNRDFGTTIILTTHDLAEIEELCERIIILDKGRIIHDGSLKSVKAVPGLGKRAHLEFGADVSIDDLNETFQDKVVFSLENERLVNAIYDPKVVSTVDLVKGLVTNYNVLDFNVSEPNIEEVVMKIYNDGVK